MRVLKQVVEHGMKRKYPKKYLSVDKIGWKVFSEEILFRVELIASSFLI